MRNGKSSRLLFRRGLSIVASMVIVWISSVSAAHEIPKPKEVAPIEQILPQKSWASFENQVPGDWVVYLDSVGRQRRFEVVAVDPVEKSICIDVSTSSEMLEMTLLCSGDDMVFSRETGSKSDSDAGESQEGTEVFEGEETIEINGNSYACHFIETRVAGQDAEVVQKKWFSKQVPVVFSYGDAAHGGLVKSAVTAGDASFEVVLQESFKSQKR